VNQDREKGKLKVVRNSVHIIPSGFWLPNRQLAHQLSLPEILDFGVNQISQTFKVDAALSPGTHEQVPPDSSGGDRVVNAKLQRTVEANHLLHQVIWAGVVCVRPSNTNGEPPSKRPAIW
jgi:hypothetical protein